jgi:hypothetical protein
MAGTISISTTTKPKNTKPHNETVLHFSTSDHISLLNTNMNAPTMIRNTILTNSSQCIRRIRCHRSVPLQHKPLSDGEQIRTVSSLTLRPFQHPTNYAFYLNRDNEENTNNSLPQPISLLNNKKYNATTTRQYHTTLPSERGAAIVLTLGAVAATAKAGQYVVQGYKEWTEASQAAAEEEEKRKAELKAQGIDVDEQQKQDEESTANAQGEESANQQSKAGGDAGKKGKEQPRENFFAKFFNLSVGSKYYEGAFDHVQLNPWSVQQFLLLERIHTLLHSINPTKTKVGLKNK